MSVLQGPKVNETPIADGPAGWASPVTKSDTNTLAGWRALYVGTAGDLVIDTDNATDTTFKNVPAGTIIPVRAIKVKAATTAADIVALG